jgi:hypothetical protein
MITGTEVSVDVEAREERLPVAAARRQFLDERRQFVGAVGATRPLDHHPVPDVELVRRHRRSLAAGDEAGSTP